MGWFEVDRCQPHGEETHECDDKPALDDGIESYATVPVRVVGTGECPEDGGETGESDRSPGDRRKDLRNLHSSLSLAADRAASEADVDQVVVINEQRREQES